MLDKNSDPFFYDMRDESGSVLKPIRDQIGADFITFFGPIETGGRGGQPGFNSINTSAYLPATILEHETGRNLNGGHGKGNRFTGNDGRNYKTVMAYGAGTSI